MQHGQSEEGSPYLIEGYLRQTRVSPVEIIDLRAEIEREQRDVIPPVKAQGIVRPRVAAIELGIEIF